MHARYFSVANDCRRHTMTVFLPPTTVIREYNLRPNRPRHTAPRSSDAGKTNHQIESRVRCGKKNIAKRLQHEGEENVEGKEKKKNCTFRILSGGSFRLSFATITHSFLQLTALRRQ